MFFLGAVFGFFIGLIIAAIQSSNDQKRASNLDIRERELEEKIKLQEKLFEEKTKGFPWIAEREAEHYKTIGIAASEYLRYKKYPSYKSAETVKDISNKLKVSKKEASFYKGLVLYYEYLVPWLADFKDAPDDIIQSSCNDNTDTFTFSEEDPATKYMLGNEWNQLSRQDRFQIALERYWKKRKTNWEIGIDYERFIGFEYEAQGYDVTYFGALKGLEDMGRDLIVKKGRTLRIVQCKRWSQEKIIHEKHIFQLFGSCIAYQVEQDLKTPPKGIFITSCSLSDKARKFAEFLNIEVLEKKPFQMYPCIKCNISISGEKIYHLPFDQQYDKVKINGRGECYVGTILEAEKKGFRRAFRWKGNKDTGRGIKAAC